MSRLSTSQIIAKGDYLEPNFEPNSLTIAQLVGIFAFHEVNWQEVPKTKPNLVRLFEREIKANGEELRRKRREMEDTLASGNGIVNGVTGSPASPPARQLPLRQTRRSSRGLSAEPTIELPQTQTTSKRRRASAEPTVGRRASVEPPTRRRGTRKPKEDVPAIVEESEESEPEVQPRKVGKKKDSEAAGQSSRRISRKFGPGTDDSGWEDNNIFQSGGESSPVKESRTKRRSTLRKSKRSSSPEDEEEQIPPPFSPPSTSFTPALPVLTQTPVKSDPRFKFEEDYEDDMSGLADVSAAIVVEHDDYEDVEQPERILPQDVAARGSEDSDSDSNSSLGAKAGNEFGRETKSMSPEAGVVARQGVQDRQVVKTTGQANGTSWSQRLLTVILVLVVSTMSAVYKLESAPIGYCERGSQTSEALVSSQKLRRERESCYAMHSEDGKQFTCPPLDLIPRLHPDSCTPCPEHATCDRFSLKCDEGYIYSPHPLSYIPYSELANGLPGFGPIAFPPRCVDDVLKKRNIGNLGKMIDAELARVKGERICSGIDPDKAIDGDEGRRWGLSSSELMSVLRKRKVSESFASESDFEHALFKVLGELEKYGRVLKTYNSTGSDFYASNQAALTMSCKALVAARQQWQNYRKSIFGLFLIYFTYLYGKFRLARSRQEARRVADLVQFALDALQAQEMAHHIDPVSNPHPYLSSDQLRDVVLREEHNPRRRQRMWEPIQRVIEGNANVRVSLEELASGAEGRVWSWVGTSAQALGSPQKQQHLQRTPYASPARGRFVGEGEGSPYFGHERVYA